MVPKTSIKVGLPPNQKEVTTPAIKIPILGRRLKLNILTKPNTYKLKQGNSWVIYQQQIPNEIKVDETVFERLWNLHPKERSWIKMAGKLIQAPRFQEAYGCDYWYSGVWHEARDIEDPYFKKLIVWVQKHSGLPYSSLLVNWYENGQHYIGAHSDDEAQLVKNQSIYSFTFGQERTFRIDAKKGYPKERLDLSLKNNSMVIMGGEMQTYYKHSVPKRAVSTCPGRRINITLRLFGLEDKEIQVGKRSK